MVATGLAFGARRRGRLARLAPIVGIGIKPGLPVAVPQALDRELAIERGNDDLAVTRFDRAIHHGQVAVMNAGAL